MEASPYGKSGFISTLTAIVIVALSGCSCSEMRLAGDTDTDIDLVTDDSGTDAIENDPALDPTEDPDIFELDATDTLPTDTPPFEIPDLHEWDPYDDHMGDPGWHDSTEPLCDEPAPTWDFFNSMGYDVWSDWRGVYVFLGTEFSDAGMGMRYRIYKNDGAGWSVYADLDSEDLGLGWSFRDVNLTGIPGGQLMMYPEGGNVALFDDGVLTMTSVRVNGSFIVDSSLGYATLPSAPRLAHWDGVEWTPYPGEPVPYDVENVWASNDSIFCAGQNGTMLSLDDGGEWVVHDPRTMGDFNAIWGFGRDDVWASTSEGDLVHLEEGSWQTVEWPDLNDDSDDCRQHGDPIIGMWGSGGILFMHTMTQLIMWDGASFTNLGYWPGEGPPDCTGRINITAIWGNSPVEVFLAVDDLEQESRDCGKPQYLLWWDGLEFRWL